MQSMNYLGRIVSNFKEFYNEINAATLTGAIDVVVVEQADGTFTCSPFHVRFGKLGVLRSREKVVDIEINGEPQDIHMKLGDSGEAFFVEEVACSDVENIPEYLATSPIPVSEFEKLYNSDEKPRRKSIDLGYKEQTFENQVSDYKTRRYTDSHNQDFTLKKKDFVQRQINLGNIAVDHSIEELNDKKQSDDDHNQDEIFKMDSLDSELPKPLLKTDLPKLELKVPLDDDKMDLESNKSGKKKRRKKSSMKKKNSQRKTSTISSENVPIEQDNESKLTESTDKSSLGSSHSDHDLITSADTHGNRINRDNDFLFFSDTELTTNSGHNSRPSTPVQSDTEFEVSQRKDNDDQPAGQSWAWGQLPVTPNHTDLSNITDQNNQESEVKQAERYSMLSTMFSFMKQHKRMRHNSSSEGMYLADLSSGNVDPEVTALYFPNHKTEKKSDADIDCESGNGPSLPQSPNSVEGAKSLDSDYEDHPRSNGVKRALQDVSLSLCGWGELPTEDNFVRHVVSFTDLCNNPGLLESPDLVVRIGDKYYSYRAAMPIIISLLVYQRQLPQSTIDQLCSMHMANANIHPIQSNPKQESRSYSWWSWRRRTTENIGPGNEAKLEEVKESITVVDAGPSSSKDVQGNTSTDSLVDKEGYVGSQGSSDEGETYKKNTSVEMTYGEKFRKTLRLTSEQIKKLNLHEGMNEVEFSVTTAYQGTTRCKCHIYRWRYDDKIVISDIDGTITKSDVLGHILPIVGKDWAQSGVAQLFTKIKNNGYKLLYLSARAIGQARVTREYLRSIKQGDLSLPDGPLLLNPTSLISAFHREVIEKKPEQFKISCLSDIQALFPPESNPFYAGYGNRINDVWAYRAVGIPIVRIFTINHKGELKHELTQTFQSSYSSMTSFVDQLFPPQLEDANAYSQFVYWREPITPVDEMEKLF